MCDGLLDVEGGSRFDRINDGDMRLTKEAVVAEAESKLSGGMSVGDRS